MVEYKISENISAAMRGKEKAKNGHKFNSNFGRQS